MSLREMFQGKFLKALTIGAGLVLFQQITWQPSVLYHAASILQLIMTGAAVVVVVDRLGRRPLLLGGVSGMLSFGPIGWLMISEIFPLRLRGRGLSIAVLVNLGANALVTFAFSPLNVPILFY
ncbi:hypothetical protein I3842_06G019000 [Carya illinoinensis]|uniref:Major facilitator superfamily (MFS) profile domain-containing protein n=1 Tax=Carya illinoinensis TaxID=32201 RepID=A0A922ENU1_CARIL|nr:hypothetical protein I3842_06G019000 [Carya illinoinensis]